MGVQDPILNLYAIPPVVSRVRFVGPVSGTPTLHITTGHCTVPTVRVSPVPEHVRPTPGPTSRHLPVPTQSVAPPCTRLSTTPTFLSRLFSRHLFVHLVVPGDIRRSTQPTAPTLSPLPYSSPSGFYTNLQVYLKQLLTLPHPTLVVVARVLCPYSSTQCLRRGFYSSSHTGPHYETC